MRVWVVVLIASGCRDAIGYETPRLVDAAQVDGTPDGSIDPSDAPDAPPDASVCSADYVTLSGAPNRYRLLGAVNGDWLTQRGRCALDGPNVTLAIPDDASEQSAFVQLASTDFWIGISDRATEGVFVTELGAAPAFTAFAGGEPDNGGAGDEDCVLSRSNGLWEDRKCNDQRRAICECVE